MQNFIIKTHRVGTIYPKPNLFILNKGLNGGKPQKTEFTNSFVIIFQNDDDCESAYWIAFSLWKSKFWHLYLIGSVISFLRISDFKKEFVSKLNTLTPEQDKHKKNVAALKLLEQKKAQFYQNINLIRDLRQAILFKYCNNLD